MRAKLAIAFLLGVAAGAAGSFLSDRHTPNPEAMKAALLARPEFLADHPEILEGARTVLLNRKLASDSSRRLKLTEGKWKFLEHFAFTPTIGSPEAARLLMEVTDYTCVPCRASAPFVRAAANSKSDLRVAVLFNPVGGALAEYAARIAVAAYRQNPDRFAELHSHLMEDGEPLTQERILGVLRDLKFDVDRVERDSRSDEIRRYLDQVHMFLEDIHVSGVPTFLMNERLLAGAVTASELEELIEGKEKMTPPDRAVTAAAAPSPASTTTEQR